MIASLQASLMNEEHRFDDHDCIIPIDPIPNIEVSENKQAAETFDDPEPLQSVNMGTELTPNVEHITNVDNGLRRGVRRRTPNSRYNNKDYISPAISPAVHRKPSPSVNADRLASKPPKPNSNKRKVLSISPKNSSKKRDKNNKMPSYTTNIGDITIPWPRFGINSINIYGRSCSITNTCPLDTGLFIYFHAFMAGSVEFRRIFEKDFSQPFSTLRQTFKLAIEENWDHARAYWLMEHNLLTKESSKGVYDLTNTLTEIVFRFLQPTQEYEIRSECSCSACPRKTRQTTSVDLVLTYVLACDATADMTSVTRCKDATKMHNINLEIGLSFENSHSE